jgi:hypothetical protein
MKPVEGLNIKELADEVIKEEADKAKGPIKEKLRAIVTNITTWKKELETAEKQVAKLKEKIAKAETVKTSVLSDNPDIAWKALQDDQQKKQGDGQPKKEESDD